MNRTLPSRPTPSPASTVGAASPTPVAVGVDMSILRHPHTGSARWATGLLGELTRRSDLEVRSWAGPRRFRFGGPVRKVTNALIDSYWLDVGLPRAAHATRRDVLLMPVNLSSARSSVPQVVTIHDVNFLVLPGSYDRAYASYAERMFRASTRRAAALTTVSAFSRTQIADRLGVDPERISVVYPGLDPVRPAATPDNPWTRPYGLYVGATEPHKDVPALIEAWRELSDIDLDLVIVGQPGRDHDRVLAGARASRGRVHVTGRVPGPELEAWYAHARLFAFPSRTEGFGYPPLEAMQRGIPVVASSATCLPEVLGAAALFHAPGVAPEIAAQVRRLVGDDALARRLIAAGLEVSARYSWSRAGDAMAKVIRNTVLG